MLELIQADILYTGMGMPLRGGAVVVSEGRNIVAAGEALNLRNQYPQAQRGRRAQVIAPPAVNAHTHLDMSLYSFSAQPYFEWLPWVMAQSDKRGREGTRAGAAAILESGADAGDIVWRGDKGGMEWLLTESELSGVAYWEVIDPNPATAEQTFEQVQRDIEHFRRLERPGKMRVGLSPHATYTVSARLHALLALYARREKLPVQIHVAEHPSEVELLQRGAGPLAEGFLKTVGIELPALLGRPPGPDLTPVNYLAALGVLEARPTLIHMVNVSDSDIKVVAQAGAAVVTCPRSNANLRCGTFRWADFAAAGVDVALGTDSVASGESLNIYDELRAAPKLLDIPDERLLLRAAVKGGHRVLGSRAPLLRRGEAWSERYLWPDLGL